MALKQASRLVGAGGVGMLGGADGFDHAHIVEVQRARIVSAMFEVVSERGAANVSVAHVVAASGVSRRTFYEIFEDREDCFCAAFEDALSYASERVLFAYGSHRGWRERIRAALIALLSFLDEEPVIGRLLICESFAGGERTLERRAEVLVSLTQAVDGGRKKSASDATLTLLNAEGLVGGVLAVIQARLAARPLHTVGDRGVGRDHERLVELVNPLMSMIVMQYLGSAAGRRELECSVPVFVREPKSGVLLSDPFKEAGMRLTYRTVLVLLALREHPCASNRVVGESAGIADQGQISKLLGRLRRLGLVSNASPGPGQGAPNAWTLTTAGEQVTESIRAHAGRSK